VPIETQCPSCQSKLKAPDTLLGKNVRCPSCQQTFTVEAPPDDARAETSVTAKPAEPSRKRASSITAEPEAPRRGRYEDEAEDADNDLDDEEYEEERKRKRRRRRREAAASAVAGPAIALMCVGGLAVLLSITSLLLNLIGAALLAAPQAGAGGPEEIFHAASGAVGAIFGIVWGGVVLSGAWQMYRLKTYGYAMAAAIVAMLPCNGCCLLGLPFGIWALVALNGPDVKDAFR
jgi:cation transport ATPase